MRNLELRLAFINLLRLCCLHEECVAEVEMCQREIVEEKRYTCDALDIKLLDSIKNLATEKNDRYMTYMQALGVDGVCITNPKRRCTKWIED